MHHLSLTWFIINGFHFALIQDLKYSSLIQDFTLAMECEIWFSMENSRVSYTQVHLISTDSGSLPKTGLYEISAENTSDSSILSQLWRENIPKQCTDYYQYINVNRRQHLAENHWSVKIILWDVKVTWVSPQFQYGSKRKTNCRGNGQIGLDQSEVSIWWKITEGDDEQIGLNQSEESRRQVKGQTVGLVE